MAKKSESTHQNSTTGALTQLSTARFGVAARPSRIAASN